MKLLTIIAATAAAAAIAAAITIPAGAASSDSDGTALAACLRSHGAAVPDGADGLALKQWIARNAGDATTRSALAACDASPVAPAELLACLKAKGLDAPTAIDALKPWIQQQMATAAGKAALTACGLDKAPDGVKAAQGPAKLADCLRSHGADVPADAAGGDGVALKQWIAAHADDPAVQDALKACSAAPADKGGCGGSPAPAPTVDASKQ